MRAKSFERKQAKNLLRLETRRVAKFPFRLGLSRKFKLSLPRDSHGRGESQIGKPWKNGVKKP